MTTLERLNQATRATVRDTKLIAQLYTTATQVEGLRLDIRDYMGPQRPLDLSNEGNKDHCSSAA
tara:strand:- start:423 stop:614 length:192 start_codon:yes stop_codon:yes gene_type:complete